MTDPAKAKSAMSSVDRVARRVTGRLKWRRRRHISYRVLALILAIASPLWLRHAMNSDAGETPALTDKARRPEGERIDRGTQPAPRLVRIAPTDRPDRTGVLRTEALRMEARRAEALKLRALQIESLLEFATERSLSFLRKLNVEAASLAALDGLRILSNDRVLRQALARIQTSGSVELRVRDVEILAQRSGLRATRFFWASVADLEAEPIQLEGFIAEALPRVLERFPRFAGSVPRRLSGLGLRSLARVRHAEIRRVLEREVARRGPEKDIIDALGECGDDWAFSVLVRWSQLPDQRGTQTLAAIARIPGDRSLSLLLDRFSASVEGPEELRDARHDALLRALRLRSKTLFEYLRVRIESGRVRDCEILAVSKILPESFASSFGPQLRNVDSRLRGVLCRALSSTATPDAVAALIDGLSVAELRFHARRSLGRLSGRDLGNNPDRWKLWYGRFIEQAEVERDKSSRPEASMGALSFSPKPSSSRLGA